MNINKTLNNNKYFEYYLLYHLGQCFFRCGPKKRALLN